MGYEGLSVRPVDPTIAAQWEQARTGLAQMVQAARDEIAKLPENRRAEFEEALAAIQPLASLTVTDANSNRILDTTDRSNAESAVQAAIEAKAAADQALQSAQSDQRITEEEQQNIRQANTALTEKKALATQAIAQVPETERQTYTDRLVPLTEVDVPEVTVDTSAADKAVKLSLIHI